MANEKYIDDALLQKSFTVDFIGKKKKKNECELPKYYVEGSHEAIIPKSVYEYIKNMPEKKNRGKVSGLSEKIICRYCGTDFRRFVIVNAMVETLSGDVKITIARIINVLIDIYIIKRFIMR